MLLGFSTFLPQSPTHQPIPIVHAQPAASDTLRPSKYWGVFTGSSGDVEIDIDHPGIAARLEIPREFLAGVVFGENDTHFVQSDIRNDYYYYSLVDEARHWTYGWQGKPSDGPCYKPKFTIYDPNAPWCLEIWNYLNGTFLTFTPPKFIRLVSLNSPTIAGKYNFTLYVANRTNSIGYPDFVNAWNTTIQVPVSLSDNPGSITGTICDADNPSLFCQTIQARGVVYAINNSTGEIARAYVNATTGRFNVTGLSPGRYYLRGSAGVWNVSCSAGLCPVAYSLSDPPWICNSDPFQQGSCNDYVTITRGSVVGTQVKLHRAPQICGSLNYFNGGTLQPVVHSLTDTFLPGAGFRVLNITIEATDSPDLSNPGRVFGRYLNISTDTSRDAFRVISGVGEKYVGQDPYGTEFAGLPSLTSMSVTHLGSGAYILWMHVWISGYLQASLSPVTIISMPGMRDPGDECVSGVGWGNHPQPDPILMDTGGVIGGTIQFWNLVTPETPNQAEVGLGVGRAVNNLFGGNIVVEAFDHSGILRGVTVLNGTRPDGGTSYGNSSSIPFYVVGFSEFYNRTWAGAWQLKDYGLPGDTYSLTAFIRGYEEDLANTPLVTVSGGGNQSVTVRMIRGGAVQVTVGSYDNIPGTRNVQAAMPWRFLNFSIPIKARVYFYDNLSRTVGYSEVDLVEGKNNVTLTTFLVTFAGQNWSLREIWFYGDLPTHFSDGNYTLRGYTLGYVQQTGISFPESLSAISMSFMVLLYGDEIDLIAPIFSTPSTLGQVPEHAHAIGQAYQTDTSLLAGALAANVTIRTTTIDFPIFGFGATLLNSTSTKFNSTFNGQGHFFYVGPDGTRYFDYGLEGNPPTGVSYFTQLPEFGFSVAHFMSISPISIVFFKDLFLELGSFAHMVSMAKVIQGTPISVVEGFCAGLCSPPFVMPLSWVRVSAGNSSYSRSAVTADGQYDGVEALYLPAGGYNITFSVAWYFPQTSSLFSVGWGGVYSLLPPQGILCPLADPALCSNPSPSPSPPIQGSSMEKSDCVSIIPALEDRAVSSVIEDLGV
ncbi:MAG TPA: carboxypeptidase-like regulatory domain-containing protein [Methylomirabilota bacterium]|nr:carboxypeptidase-like regulatory domain-containing protein [Methylomirabilota bacterium]